ncbi:mitochondrial proton-transporting ATP synthase complex assembly [Coemansia sp. RSA 2050]|nr:mitochondrial proton-transporting ATP synthase complex assembly [Coemansia sp. RSA 2050]KAJ2730568.1 mitochondrial proton-transporting ATP synthase complex assembly [Coemansia sp. BCRC 34962]
MHSRHAFKSAALLRARAHTFSPASRGFAVTSLHRQSAPNTVPEPVVVYEGGLSKAARVMKLASVASLVGASAAIPFFFTGSSDIPSGARTILAITTLGMTGSSTALVTWALRPYITSLSILEPTVGPATPMLVDTLTFLAQTRTRLVFPEQLRPATMPLTSWSVSEPSEKLVEASKGILELVNKGRKKPVELAKGGDVFYAHTQGPVSEEMQRIIDVSPCQE